MPRREAAARKRVSRVQMCIDVADANAEQPVAVDQAMNLFIVREES